jgi:HEAT repeat protein
LAADALASIGPKALPAMVEASRDNRRIRQPALRSLHHYCWHELPEQLRANEWQGDMRLVYAQWFQDAPRLIDAVKEHDTITRGLAIRALGDMKGQPTAIRAVTEALHDGTPRVRIEAAEALGRMGPGGKTAVPALLEALQDEGHAAEDELTASEGPFMWKPKAVREAAARALLDLGSEGEDRLVRDGLPILLAGLKSTDFDVREGSAKALSLLGPKAANAIPALVQAVEENGDQFQLAAVIALPDIGPEAVPGLVRLLGHPNPKVRWQAVSCLGGIRPRSKPLLEALCRALGDRDSSVRQEAAEVLEQMPFPTPDAIPALRVALKDEDPKVALAAANALRKGGATAEVKAVLTALLKRSDIERSHVLEALLPLGAPEPESVPLLEQLSKNKQIGYARWLAIRLLGQLNRERAEAAAVHLAHVLTMESAPGPTAGSFSDLGPAGKVAIPILLEWLEKPAEEHERRARCEAVIGALGELHAEKAVLELVRGLEDDSTFEITAEALGRMGPAAKGAVLPLTVGLRDAKERHRAAAAAALGEIGLDAKRAVPRLQPLLRDRSGEVRAWAAYACIQITGDEVGHIGILTDLLRGKTDADGGRHEAAQALARLAPRGQSAVPAVIEGLEDPDRWTRWSATVTLGKIGPAAKSAVPRLIARLSGGRPARQLMWPSDERESISAAVQALGQIGPAAAAAIPRLTELARNEDLELATAAEEALATIRATKQEP